MLLRQARKKYKDMQRDKARPKLGPNEANEGEADDDNLR